MKNEDLTCPECDSETLRRGTAEFEGTARGESFTVRMAALLCPKCSFKTIPADRAGEYALKVADAFRAKHGLLTSSQIKQRRNDLHMNQQQFAEYLRVGVASIKRWELGQIQDDALNDLMVLKTDLSFAKKNVADVRKLLGDEEEEPENLLHEARFSPTWQFKLLWEVGDSARTCRPTRSFYPLPFRPARAGVYEATLQSALELGLGA